MPLDAILDRRLLIISGKGGVGKTTLAAALGIVGARRGKRVLIAEVEGKHSLSSLFDVPPLSPEPSRLADNIFGMNISPEEALEEYFDVQFHVRRLAKPLVASQLVDYVTHAAPGLRDILMLGKVWYAATRRRAFDIIVLDTPAAGHAVSMLRSPEGFLHAVPVGPLANHSRQVLEWLQDPDQVSIHLASMAEEMPVNETIETTKLLEDKLGMDVAAIYINMLYPPISSDPAIASQIDAIDSQASLVETFKASGGKITSKSGAQLFDALAFYEARRSMQQAYRTKLVDSLSYTAKIADLPFLFCDGFGLKELETLADTIEASLA
ncbi:MAG: ArsA family ATPase [Actinomycetota bacterium]|nr:ArsA family ATPase [Actinomycetota bacterium]